MSGVDAAWRDWLLRCLEQACDDLSVSGAAEVVFVREDTPQSGAAWAEAVTDAALRRGLVVATLGIETDRSFDSLDALVRAAVLGLRSGGGRRADHTGLFELLDAFATRHGKRAASLFDAGAEALAAAGDLVALSRAYLVSASDARIEKKRLSAWLAGTVVTRSDEHVPVVATLTQRTAKHALAELSRLVRILGHRGLLLLLREGDALLHLPPARRDAAYTVLRELVDNADGGRALLGTRILLFGSTALFEGTRSLATLSPLRTRVAVLPGSAALPPPHRPLVDLAVPASFDGREAREPTAPDPAAAVEMRAIVRASQGLPPVESIQSLTVGQEAIDRVIDNLFEHAAMQGSVFALLTGEYGSGKTHLLLHFAARALEDKRPVLRLSLERLDVDLGNPQRHLRRLLDGATLPGRARATAIDKLLAWTRSEEGVERLVKVLEKLAEEESEAGRAATRALARATRPKTRAAALESFLGGADLVEKPNGSGYRADAYARLLLWLELLERVEKCAGPVLIIDEAENLYRPGISRAERRTALRSLSFYCGGALPRACVVLAITPDVLGEMRAESRELLEEVSEQITLLASEDAAMLRRRLWHIKPIEVPALTEEHRATLLARVRATHARARGTRSGREWTRFADALLSERDLSAREFVRRAVDWLEASWWQGGEAG